MLTIHVYITRLGDTISGLATRFADSSDPQEIERYQQKLIEYNRYNQKLRRFLTKNGVIRSLPDSTFINIPDPIGHDDSVRKTELTALKQEQHVINTKTVEERQSFAKLIHHTDIDLERFAVALQFLDAIRDNNNPQSESDDSHGLLGDLASGIMTLSDASSGYYAERAQLFHNSLSNVADKVGDYLKAPGHQKGAAKQAYLDAHMEMNERFNREIDDIIGERRPRAKKRHFLRNANRFANKTRSSRHGFSALETDDVKALLKHGTAMKIVNRSFVFLEVSMSVLNVFNTYQAGDDWQKELFTESASLLAGAAIGAIIVAPLAGAGASAISMIIVISVTSYAASELANYIASELWDEYVGEQ